MHQWLLGYSYFQLCLSSIKNYLKFIRLLVVAAVFASFVSLQASSSGLWFVKWFKTGVAIKGFLEPQSPLIRYVNNCKSHRFGKKILAQGAAYELHVVEHLLESDCSVCSVCQKRRCMHQGKELLREIDIETDEAFIECKDINWPKVSGNKVKEIKKQLKEQALIAQAHGKQFRLYSQREVPAQWRAWMVKHHITIVEVSKSFS